MSDLKQDIEIKYSEWVPLSIFATIAFFLIIALIIAVAISSIIYDPMGRIVTLAICVPTGLFLLLIWLNYRGIRITITNSDITVKYGIFNKKTIPFTEIVSCEITKATFKTYIGFGVRIGTDSSLGFTTGFGKAIKLTLPEKRPFAFSTNNPQVICDILTKK
jgi:membrane protein YdbS with pleckstrin-like domain